MSKRVFIDTNVVIDFLGQREPFIDDAEKIFALVYKGKIKASVASITISTASYVLEKSLRFEAVKELLAKFADLVNIEGVGKKAVMEALSSESLFTDIEDAMQYSAAKSAGCDCIITRDAKGFVTSTIPVYTPSEFVEKIENGG